MSFRSRRLGLVICGLLLAGCSYQVWPDQPAADSAEPALLAANGTWGQSFVALEAGLTDIDVQLAPSVGGGPATQINLHLRSSPDSTADLAAATLLLSAITQPDFYHFEFQAQPDSQRRSYFLLLELTGDGSALVGHAAGDRYENGALYQSGEPIDRQMAFRLGYERAWLARGILADAATWLGWTAPAVFLFVVPGWALLTGLWPQAQNLGWAEQLGLAIGLSLAIYPVLFLWTHILGLHLGPLYAWLPPSVGLGVLAAGEWRRGRGRWSVSRWFGDWRRSGRVWSDLVFSVVVCLILLTRFWAARQAALPLFGDSYQHSVIAQLIVDHGGLFDSWQPYADLQSFTYHFGFHSLVAVFHWLSGLPVPQSVLWVGQILNGLSIVAIYPLAVRMGRSPWAGIVAMAVAGLLSPMPMFYTNWGRYTQLAGQAILPAVVYLVWVLLEEPKWDWRLVALGSLVLGGLALTHYRILIFAVIFLAAALIFFFRRIPKLLPRAAVLGIISGLIFLPWFWHVYGGRMAAVLVAQVTTLPAAISLPAESNFSSDLLLYPAWWWILALGALAIGLWRHDKTVVLVVGWWGLVLLAANPKWVGLPGEGVLTDLTVLIAMYIPAALLVGSAVAGRLRDAPRRGALAGALVLVMALWGARSRLSEVRPAQFGLATWADIRAAEWIKAHTPAQARFLVNSFFIYGDRLVVGSDGGWWLPLLAERATTLPPLNYALEQGDHPDNRVWVNTLPAAIQEKGVADGAVLQLLTEHQIGYVYIGQKRGRVNNNGPDYLAPELLLANPHYRPVYHEDRVWIFEVVQNP